EGQQEQTMDSVRSLFIGFVVALLAIFVVLTIEFKSYFQPFIILLIIPFGLIGSVWGHAILGLSLTLFSLCGIVALTGVVINDSIVLIDFINRQSKEGMPLKEAILEAVQHRFRPVLLTSLTTIAGLLPLLLETSFQAQLLKPMATSITFGLMSGTVLILYLVPGFYIIYGNCQAWLHSWRTVEKTFSE
ncbi:MAG: efflux RND transporter permease subunit, partial [Planctomycetaceae bacterium]|nr:efflux RND transporter permease subunit [Planctomycetaceae bacterium]